MPNNNTENVASKIRQLSINFVNTANEELKSFFNDKSTGDITGSTDNDIVLGLPESELQHAQTPDPRNRAGMALQCVDSQVMWSSNFPQAIIRNWYL